MFHAPVDPGLFIAVIQTKKKRSVKNGSFFLHLRKSVATLFGFATFDFTRLFIVPAVTQFFEGSLLVKLLFQPTQSAVDDLTFFDADFGMHGIHPLSTVYSYNIF